MTPPRRRRRRVPRMAITAIGVWGLVMVLAGCDDNASSDTGEAADRVSSNEWVLVPAKSSIEVDAGNNVTLEVDGETVSGQGPCNRYHGTIEIDGDSVTISKLASTLMACDDATSNAEQAYFQALESADTIHVTDDTLELSDGETLAYEAK